MLQWQLLLLQANGRLSASGLRAVLLLSATYRAGTERWAQSGEIYGRNVYWVKFPSDGEPVTPWREAGGGLKMDSRHKALEALEALEAVKALDVEEQSDEITQGVIV